MNTEKENNDKLLQFNQMFKIKIMAVKPETIKQIEFLCGNIIFNFNLVTIKFLCCIIFDFVGMLIVSTGLLQF